tara:strand:- start:392 stop:541 length:150 start_codon:yes stop_codon:yes gene_type:complete
MTDGYTEKTSVGFGVLIKKHFYIQNIMGGSTIIYSTNIKYIIGMTEGLG